tara:strand:+ start:11169 stop:13070 length:1902 start_codon:yes stop_codon:yes gene_type:complete
MRIYLIKVNNAEVVRRTVDSERFTHDGIYNFEQDIEVGDAVFIYLGGDRSLIDWSQGIRGVGKVVATPYDKGYDTNRPRNFKIDIEPTHILADSIPPKSTKIHKQLASQLYDIPYVGANHFPNQAIASSTDETGIRALVSVYQEYGDYQFLEFPDLAGLVEPPSGLPASRKHYARIATALQAKRFLILTGLSGSGKTLQALSFCKWLSPPTDSSRFALLETSLLSEEFQANYEVVSFSSELVEVINRNGESGKIIPLPTQAIYEWHDALKGGLIANNDDPKAVRHDIGEGSRYQKHIHGFYNELFKLAVRMAEATPATNEKMLSCVHLVPVGADWTSSEHLLGYPDALQSKSYRKPDSGVLDFLLRAKGDPSTPYFLILDEMNLSHVERYFSDFLSAMESGESIHLHDDDGQLWDGVPAELPIPANLFVIGTVNVDETTYMFSPKVLDRANVIEFSVSEAEISTFLEGPYKPDLREIEGAGSIYADGFLQSAMQSAVRLEPEHHEKVAQVLRGFFPHLEQVGAEFGYRTAYEIYRYVFFNREWVGSEWDFQTCMDEAIYQKLLPKLHGSKRRLQPVLDSLTRLCLKDGVIGESDQVSDELLRKENALYWNSLVKLRKMAIRLSEQGFTSFAEA